MGAPKGHPRYGGRVKGTPNSKTVEQKLEAEVVARSLVGDKKYLAKLTARLCDGTVSPQVEQMLWQYAFGKPPDTLKIQGDAAHPLTFQLEQAHKSLEEVRHARLVS